MEPTSVTNGVVALGATVLVDLLWLWRGPRNLAVAFVELTCSFTLVGAAWLAQTRAGYLAVLALGLATKVLVYEVFRWLERRLRQAADERPCGNLSERLYHVTAGAVIPFYLLLVARGGLAWFSATELRVSYTSENSILLRLVRQWTPILFIWGVSLLIARRKDRTAPRSWRWLTVSLLVVQFVAYGLLDGSKAAALNLAVMTGGAVQVVGYRPPRRVALAFGGGALFLLVFFVSYVASESGLSLVETFGARVISGAEGLLYAVEPPDGKYCSIESLWYPLTNLFSKVFYQTATEGYASMGHCLAATDPSYPWELLLPFLAVGYHIHAWSTPLFLLTYVGLARILIGILLRACEAAGVREIAFSAAFFLVYRLLAASVDGKVTNLLVSEYVSIGLLVTFVSVIKLRYTRSPASSSELRSARFTP